jgi:hypothetical protein
MNNQHNWNVTRALLLGGSVDWAIDELGTAWQAEADKPYDLTQRMLAIDGADERQNAQHSANYEAFLVSQSISIFG